MSRRWTTERQAVHTSTGIVWFPKTDRDRKIDRALGVEGENIARAALHAPDGLEQWRRRAHSRCNPSATPPIACPWCDEYRSP